MFPGSWWKTAAVVTVAGALTLSGCAESNESGSAASSSPTTANVEAKPREGRRPRGPSSRGHPQVRQLVVGVTIPYTPNEYKDTDGKIVGFDVDPLDAVAATLGLATDYRESDFRQDHPVDRRRRLQRRDVVVHRHQGTRAAGRLRHLLLGRRQWASACRSRYRPRNACGKKVSAMAASTQEIDELPAKSKQCVDAGKPEIQIISFDGQDAVTNAVVLGQADAMSADSR